MLTVAVECRVVVATVCSSAARPRVQVYSIVRPAVQCRTVLTVAVECKVVVATVYSSVMLALKGSKKASQRINDESFGGIMRGRWWCMVVNAD